MQLGTETTVYAEKLLVHDGRKRQSTKGVHARVIYSFRIFVFALELEGEVIGQMAAFVVTSE